MQRYFVIPFYTRKASSLSVNLFLQPRIHLSTMPIALLKGNRGIFSELEDFLHPTVVTQAFMLKPLDLLCEENILPEGSYLSDDQLFFSMKEGYAIQRMRDSISNPSLANIAIEAFSHERPEPVLEQLIIKKRLISRPIPVEVFNRSISYENTIPRHVMIALLSRLKPIRRDIEQPLALYGGQNLIPIMHKDGRLGRCLVSSLTTGDGKWIVMLDKKGDVITHIPAGRTLVIRSRITSIHLPQAPWF